MVIVTFRKYISLGTIDFDDFLQLMTQKMVNTLVFIINDTYNYVILVKLNNIVIIIDREGSQRRNPQGFSFI